MKLRIEIINFVISININEYDTICEIKDKLYNEYSVPVYQQKMIHNSIQLEDDKMISNYNMKNNDIIKVVLRN